MEERRGEKSSRAGELVGRTRELACLKHAAEESRARRRRVVLVSGEAGIGKSRLVGEFAAGAVDDGWRVLVGNCIHLAAQPLAYAPIVQALRGLRGNLDAETEAWLTAPARTELRRLVPSVSPRAGRDDNEVSQARLFESVVGLLERASAVQPLVLCIEDLHWADQSSLDLLTFAINGLTDGRLLVVLTVRLDDVHHDDPVIPYLAELRRSPFVTRLELGRLSRDEIGQLAAQVLGTEPRPALTRSIYERSDGNPFLAEELLAAGSTGQLPETLRELALLRVHGLGDQARTVLRAASISARGIDHDALASITGLGEQTLAAAVREAIERHLLVVDPGAETYRFRHVLTREAVYGELLPGERRRLHLAYAEVLAAATAEPDATTADELAHHWDRGRRKGEAVAAYLRAARQEVAVAAFPEAYAHYERALELLDEQETGWSSIGAREAALLLADAATTAYFAGENEQATRWQRASHERLADIGGAGVAERTRSLARLAHMEWMSGHVEDGFGTIEQARLTAQGDEDAQPVVLAERARMLMLVSRFEDAGSDAQLALAAAIAVGARLEEGRSLTTLGVTEAVLGDTDAGARTIRNGLRIAEEFGDIDEVTRAYLDLNYVLWQAGRVDEALAVALEGIAAGRRMGVEWTLGLSLSANAAEMLVHLGRWAEADGMIREAFARGIRGMPAHELHYAGCLLTARRGELDAAKLHLAGFVKSAAPIASARTRSGSLVLEAEIAVQEGHWPQLRAIAAAGLADVPAADRCVHLPSLCLLGIQAEAELAVIGRAGRDDDAVATSRFLADRLLAELRELAARHDVALLRASLALGKAERRRIDREDDPNSWLEGEQALEAAGDRYAGAYASMRLAASLLHAGRGRSEASAALTRAYEVAVELGARPLQRQVELLASHARIELATERAAAADPADAVGRRLKELGLTPREIEVLGLVVEGRTNRQIAEALFVTEKTAALHVSSILSKLSVSNRVEAARVAHLLGLAPARA